MTDNLPIWTEPITLEGWPTYVVDSADLHYALPIRQGWNPVPEVDEMPMQVEHIYRGVYATEWLTVSFMAQADPSGDLKNWMDAVVNMAGFPILAMHRASDPPAELLEWQYVGAFPTLSERLGVEEALLYQGMAKLPGKPPGLARLYALLARRGTLAWKVCLAFDSACPPGVPEEMVVSNDHVRAGATFGYVQFT
jgi:hypothetical protein